MILERSSYEENFTYHLKYPISQKKKKAALENVMQFLEFLTTAEAASDVWIKINGAIESREISQNPITLKRRLDGYTFIERDTGREMKRQTIRGTIRRIDEAAPSWSN